MPDTLSVPARFNGPLESGNGGYSAGVVAAFVDGPAEVSLRLPVPLDRPLQVFTEDGRAVRVLDGDDVVAEGRAAPAFALEPPAPVRVEEARAARARYRGLSDGVFSRCFVCGRARGDAFGVFAGQVDGREVVASPWTPPSWAADAQGAVFAEFVWAVLDCPTFFAVYLGEELGMSVLAQLTARIQAPVPAEEEHVVMAWPLEVSGRKRWAGSAVLSAAGEPLAVARALLIELRET
jgi:hypothetical protein